MIPHTSTANPPSRPVAILARSKRVRTPRKWGSYPYRVLNIIGQDGKSLGAGRLTRPVKTALEGQIGHFRLSAMLEQQIKASGWPAAFRRWALVVGRVGPQAAPP